MFEPAEVTDGRKADANAPDLGIRLFGWNDASHLFDSGLWLMERQFRTSGLLFLPGERWKDVVGYRFTSHTLNNRAARAKNSALLDSGILLDILCVSGPCAQIIAE
jgi:hypothetical protein